MSKNEKIVDLYENLAKKKMFGIVTSGRYLITSLSYPKKLAIDIINKLDLSKHDELFEVGCNVGIYHQYISQKVSYLFASDIGPSVIELAKERNRKLKNISYFCFDVTKDWPSELIDKKFNKVLVYSVVHFLNDEQSLVQFLTSLKNHMNVGGRLLLGEVRTVELHSNFKMFQESSKGKITFRNLKFVLAKKIQSIYVGTLPTLSCTYYSSKTILNIGNELGFEVTEIQQKKFHPFYNTCSDFLFELKRE